MKVKSIILSAIVLLMIYAVFYTNNSVSFIITTIAMMIIPAIKYFKNGSLLEYESGKKICDRNIGIALGMITFIDIILLDGFTGQVAENLGRNLVISLIYYLINKELFVTPKNNVKNKQH